MKKRGNTAKRAGMAMLAALISVSAFNWVPVSAEESSGGITGGVTKDDPGFTYEGTSRDWWPANDYYYLESPEVKLTVGTVRTAGMDPKDWTDNASGNNKWGSLTRGHMMDAVPKQTMQENLDYTEFVLSDNLGVTPADEAAGKHMEWSWFHPLHKLEFPNIRLDGSTIAASGDWDFNDQMKSSVRYSIVEGTPLIKMEVTLDNRTGKDFNGSFGYIIDPDQPGEQHSYLPGRNWVYSQEKNPIREGWTENYLFSGINNTFSGKTAHAIIWPQDQQPKSIMHEAIFMGTWFEANIPNGQSKDYVVYHLPHVAGPGDKPYAVAEFWARFIRDNENPADYGSILGQLTNEAGEPVAFSEVEARDGSGALYSRAMTDKNGKYQIFAKKGIYEITPMNSAYSMESRTVELNGGDRLQTDFLMRKFAEMQVTLPSVLAAEEPFEITVSVKNVTDQPIQDVQLEIRAPYFVHLLESGKGAISELAPGEQKEWKVQAAALEGGRSDIQATASKEGMFQLISRQSFDAFGAGYYGGDNHTHTKHSDGVNTIAENSASVYGKRLLSWAWSQEHNKFSHKADADQVTASYDGRFLSLAGTEVTTSMGHALVYGNDQAPRFDIDGQRYTWQDSINEVTNQGSLFYFAHPFEQTYALKTPYEWRGFTGVEVWNGTWHALDRGVNERAFKFWDEINIRGDRKYYGITNTDAHTRDKAGDTYSKGRMEGLTEENVLELLRTGSYFGTNGPEIRFSLDGIDMGGTLRINESGKAVMNIEAMDPNSSLTRVQVIKYPVTGDMADYDKREIVFEEDLTGQGKNLYLKSLEIPVKDREFYRLEVFSEKSNENSSGIGPLTGTGFAYSNPIWIEAGTPNSVLVESLAYDGEEMFEGQPRFGIGTLGIIGDAFQVENLQIVTRENAQVSDLSFKELVSGTAKQGILKFTVTAEDGTARDYRYLISLDTESMKNADLSALSLSQGELSLAFHPNVTEYDTEVTTSVNSVRITALASDIKAKIAVNGTELVDGQISDPVKLNPGINNIRIDVTARDGQTVKSYTVRVNRTKGTGTGKGKGGEQGLESHEDYSAVEQEEE